MNRTASSGSAGSAIGGRPPFTASQWEELEHQALIFKYLITGIPVPPELLLTIRRNYDSIAASFYSHPSSSLSFCSLYRKKVDPEPGRCRRTDGRKWRCSKDAYTDSKYCERHMHRGRSRSRKPVETSQAIPHSQSSSSTEKPVAPSSAENSGSGGVAGGESFRGLPFRSVAAAPAVSSSQVQIDPVSLSYGMPAAIGAPAKDFSPHTAIINCTKPKHRLKLPIVA
ncbi:Growth-regulating factor 3 [Platanthera guangdongensis]|uniref:Growth-regulating factor n=1 Tax=Platanthera guangdongensis TaxID=2320717 RepID=A0ABR2MLM4_9ASPA